jgi:hypothetical protein
MNRGALLAIPLAVLGLGGTARAAPEFAGSVRLFEITQPNGLRRTVPAVEQAQPAHTFYAYRSASSHTGYERRLRSILFLHRDILTDALSLIITHGIDETGQPRDQRQPDGRVDFDLSGVPHRAHPDPRVHGSVHSSKRIVGALLANPCIH